MSLDTDFIKPILEVDPTWLNKASSKIRECSASIRDVIQTWQDTIRTSYLQNKESALENVEAFKLEATEYLENQWQYYVNDRCIFSGLAISVITTAAAAYLFQGVSPQSGAIFGIVNYTAVTALSESTRSYSNVGQIKMIGILGISYLISKAFMKTVCRVSLSHHKALILAVAAIAGQLYRDRVIASREQI